MHFIAVSGRNISHNQLQACSNLFSNHYGVWGDSAGKLKGSRVRLSPRRLQELLSIDGSWAALCFEKDLLIGHALALRHHVINLGWVSWVTQLVVHKNYRCRGIAKRLLNSIWGFSNDFAWGFTTANPYAIRALEKATRRRCDPSTINKYITPLMEIGQKINYIRGRTLEVTDSKSVINSEFFLDQSSLQEMLNRVTDINRSWTLGNISEGQEWFAFTFKEQPEFRLTRHELNEFFENSEYTIKEAYSRMRIDEHHLWAQHTSIEVDFIIKELMLSPQSTILDFGCSTGRHVRELAIKGFRVTGVDYLESAIRNARSKADFERPHFVVGDCRDISFRRKFDVVLCLYDLIGTYPDDQDNYKILENIAKNLRSGGKTLISVMNMEMTENIALYKETIYNNPNALLSLGASNIMQRSGDIFDPNYFIVDPESNLVYRKEQFSGDFELPAEFIVRDRRFRRIEIVEWCKEAGLEIGWSRYVQAGRWEKSLGATDKSAKEILFLAEKR